MWSPWVPFGQLSTYARVRPRGRGVGRPERGGGAVDSGPCPRTYGLDRQPEPPRWLAPAMTTVAMFPSVLGIRAGVRDAAERLRHDGHEVLVADLYGGRTFDDYEPAMAFAEEELGHAELMRRARVAVADLPDGFVSAGFSLGCVMAVHVATQRAGVRRSLMIAGALPTIGVRRRRAVAGGCPRPRPTPPSTTRWREQEMIDEAVPRCRRRAAPSQVFDYPVGDGFHRTGSLPAEDDPVGH